GVDQLRHLLAWASPGRSLAVPAVEGGAQVDARLGAHARQPAQSATAGGRLQLVERGDAGLLPEDGGGAWADPRHRADLDERGRDLGFELLEVPEASGADQLGDLLGDRRTEAHDLEEGGLVLGNDVGELAREILD